eukprot:TRINITY_DN5978_c0_g2_i1.p1 TRINITY_DN5978_c0_g2~~TRINITY_DN5978_c0_g2_i1.p1  ORF type:complete len:189 (+),score=24.24 TRINITY_DN5978_c0_g2_i1:203-769(+)
MGEPNAEDIEIHKVVQKYADNPLYLCLNVNPPPGRELSLSIYEGSALSTAKEPTVFFQKLNYLITSLPAERVAVEDMAKSHEATVGASSFVLSMIQPLNAVKMLKSQLGQLLKMVEAEPKLRKDQEFLRKLDNIMSRVPLMPTPSLGAEEKTELAEVALVNEIALMAKTVQVLQEVAEKYKQMDIDKQ